MKKILLDGTKNYYKANMHCHSTYSDGAFSVEQLKELYKAEGYSVIAFTDHEHLVDNSSLNDEDFLAITACEIAVKEDENKSSIMSKDMKVAHFNLYSLDPHNINTPCYSSVYDHFLKNPKTKELITIPQKDYKRVYSHKGITEIIKAATEQGFLVSYNHPRWSLETALDYLGYEGLWAVEIFNTGSWRKGYFEYDISVYDELLRADNCKFCVAGDDNHKNHDMFGGFVSINSEKLDYQSIMSALKEGNFYTSTGPKIISLYIEDGIAHLSVEKGAKYAVMTTGVRKTKLIDLENEDINDIKFNISSEYKYVRFDVIDDKNRRANTNAYKTEDIL